MSLQDIFTPVADFVSSQTPETLKFLFNHTIKTPVWAVLGFGGFAVWQWRKTNQAVKALNYKNHIGRSAVVSRTEYKTSADGKALEQKIHTEVADLDLESVFGDKLGGIMMDVLDKASASVTGNEPSPFQQLDKVFYKQRVIAPYNIAHGSYKGIDQESFIRELSRRWQNVFGALLDRPEVYHERYTQHFLKLLEEDKLPALGEDLPPVRVYPILVNEPYAHNKQYRVLLLTDTDIDQVLEADKDTVQIRRGGVATDNIIDNQKVRFSTNRALAEHLRGESFGEMGQALHAGETWWRNSFSVEHNVPVHIEMALRQKYAPDTLIAPTADASYTPR